MSASQQIDEGNGRKSELVTVEKPTTATGDGLLEAIMERSIPRLTDRQREQAIQLAEKLDPGAPQAVLTFGETAQRGASEFSKKVLEGASMRDAGSIGGLIEELGTSVQSIDPSVLREAKGFVGGCLKLIPGYDAVEKRVGRFVTSYRGVEPGIKDIEDRMTVARQEAFVTLEQLGELKDENGRYREILKVVIAAVMIASNAAAKEYNEKRIGLGKDADLSEYSALKHQWNALQRLDRRTHALQVSLALTHTVDEEIEKVKELVAYNAEVLGEAVQHMLPSWRTQLALSITLIETEDQREAVEAARELTDKFVLENVKLSGNIEDAQLLMQNRTFVAAEVVAAVNNQFATQLTAVKAKQEEARKTRANALAIINASQENLARAMREDAQSLIETAATPSGVPALNVSSRVGRYDVAAELLNPKKP